MRKILLLAVVLLLGSLSSCFSVKPTVFKGRYSTFLEPGETEVETTYQSMISKKGTGEYVYRFYYPEKMLLTKEVHYMDRFLKNKNGKYTIWSDNGILLSVGQFRSNKAIGEWQHYHRKSGTIHEKGEMIDDKREGEWKEYDDKGRISDVVSYVNGLENGPFEKFDSTGILLNSGIYQEGTIISQTLKLENDIEEHVKETMPYLAQCRTISDENERMLCSDKALIKYVYSNLKYPRKAREYGVEGKAYIQFVVEVDGSISKIEAVKGLSDLVKYECIRVIKNMPPWVAGTQKGKSVRVLYTMPFTFKLE